MNNNEILDASKLLNFYLAWSNIFLNRRPYKHAKTKISIYRLQKHMLLYWENFSIARSWEHLQKSSANNRRTQARNDLHYIESLRQLLKIMKIHSSWFLRIEFVTYFYVVRLNIFWILFLFDNLLFIALLWL